MHARDNIRVKRYRQRLTPRIHGAQTLRQSTRWTRRDPPLGQQRQEHQDARIPTRLCRPSRWSPHSPSPRPAAAAEAAAARAPTAPVTLTWWHNGTAEPALAPGSRWLPPITRRIRTCHSRSTRCRTRQFRTKVPLALQGNDPPDIYQQWGGGGQATQVKSGKLMDMTSAVSSWIETARQRGEGLADRRQAVRHPVRPAHRRLLVPHRSVLPGPASPRPPATIDDLNADVTKLKAAGITPIAIGSKDKWPDAFWWEYFAIRECSTDTSRTR